METIIGLLFILLPVLFKFIEKKLQESGKAAQAEKMKEIHEMFFEEEEPVQPVAEDPVPVFSEKREVTVAPVKKKPVMMAEEKKIEKEKIDPRKLVIYSEIMKPKYQE